MALLQSIEFITHQQQEFKLQTILPKSLFHAIEQHGSSEFDAVLLLFLMILI